MVKLSFSFSDKQTSGKPARCSAVSCLDRDIPDFDYSQLVQQFRATILAEDARAPGYYPKQDIDKFRSDDWWPARYLLRQDLNLDKALDMARKVMKYNRDNYYWFKHEEIAKEFYLTETMFAYEQDRCGNTPVYMIVQRNRKLPEVQEMVNNFIYRTFKQADERADGRGIALIIDNTNAGLANADMDSLLYIIQTLINYFPKGLSYILVHNMPWYFKPFWQLVKTLVPAEYFDLIKFSSDKTITEYVDRENLPPVMGGTCKAPTYQAHPLAPSLVDIAKFWGVEQSTVRRVFEKIKDMMPDEHLEAMREFAYTEKPEELNQDHSDKYWGRLCDQTDAAGYLC